MHRQQLLSLLLDLAAALLGHDLEDLLAIRDLVAPRLARFHRNHRRRPTLVGEGAILARLPHGARPALRLLTFVGQLQWRVPHRRVERRERLAQRRSG